MLKKIMAFFIVFCMQISVCTVAQGTDECSLVFNNTIGKNILCSDKAYVTVSVTSAESKNVEAAYKIYKYSESGYNECVTEGSVSVTTAANKTQMTSFQLKNPDNGLYKMVMEFLSDDTCIETAEAEFSVIDRYTEKFSDVLSKMGASLQSNYDGSEILAAIGINTARAGVSWETVQKTADSSVWDFTTADERMSLMQENGISPILSLSFNNRKLFDITETQGPSTEENIKGYVDYCVKMAERYPFADTFVIWNEPNLEYFWPDPNPVLYANLVKEASKALKAVRPDCTIVCGVLSCNTTSERFLTQLMQQGIHRYADAISYHPYVCPSGADSKTLDKHLDTYRDIVDSFGGWKDLYITEIGWPTSTVGGSDNGRGTTLSDQADNLTKSAVKAKENGVEVFNWYCFADRGTDLSKDEDCFGLLKNDRSAKSAFVAMSTFMNEIGGAGYLGNFISDDGSVQAYFYNVDGKIKAVSWTTAESADIPFAFTGNVKDVYGNDCEEPILTKSPVYIDGVSEEAVLKEVSVNIEKIYADVKSVIDVNAEEMHLLTGAQLLTKLGENFEAGKKIAQSAAINNETMLDLYNIYRAGKIWASAFAYKGGDTAQITELRSENAVADAYAAVNQAEADVRAASVDYARSVLKMAEKHRDNAKKLMETTIESTVKSSSIRAEDELAVYTAQLAQIIASGETKSFEKGFSAYITPDAIESKGENTLTAVLRNNNSEDVSGELCICDDSGNVLDSENITVNGGEEAQVLFTINIPVSTLGGDYLWNMRLYEGEEVLYEKAFYVNLPKLGPYSTDGAITLPETTPVENVFAVDGTEYILLDTTDKRDSKYFVIQKNITRLDRTNGTKYDLNGSVRFNPDDPDNIAYMLNSTYDFPSGIKQYINKNHEWFTESGTAASSCPTEYMVTCGVNLLSRTEWNEYGSKIGRSDGVSTAHCWWLRTPANENNVMLAGRSSDGNLTKQNAVAGQHIRPVFYLSEDFFRNIKAENMGENVLASITGIYTEDELSQAGYSEDIINRIAKKTPYIEGLGYIGNSLKVKNISDRDSVVWMVSDFENGGFTVIENENTDVLKILPAFSEKFIKASVNEAEVDGAVWVEKALAPVSGSNNATKIVESQPENNPAEYMFTVSATNESFSLLDVTNNSRTKYFVQTAERVTARQFDPDGTNNRFDLSDENGIAYWLNNDYYNSVLSETVRPFVETQLWRTEAGAETSSCPEEYVTEAKVAILSYNEYKAFGNRFGYRTGTAGFFLRSPMNIKNNPYSVMRVWRNDTSRPTRIPGAWSYTGVTDSQHIRPVFYLSEDFFKEVKLDVASMGSEVKRMLINNYTKADILSAGYTYAELEEIENIDFEAKITVNADGNEISDINGKSAFTVTAVHSKNRSEHMYAAVYDRYGKLCNITSALLDADGETVIDIELEAPAAVQKLVCFFWEKDTLRPIFSRIQTDE